MMTATVDAVSDGAAMVTNMMMNFELAKQRESDVRANASPCFHASQMVGARTGWFGRLWTRITALFVSSA